MGVSGIISPLAYIDPRAHLGRDVKVGAFAYIGADVALGDECVVHPHATLLGPATFGARNQFYPHCCLGAAPQDLKYRGGPTQLLVGDDNVFRENVTVHRGTEIDHASGGATRIGSHNLVMVGVHVAHDSEVGSHCILANNCLLAGHVRIEDCCNIAGAVAMHHFVTVGAYAYVTGMTRVTRDIPPFTIVQGFDGEIIGMNSKGLARWKFDAASIEALERAGKLLFPNRRSARVLSTLDAIAEIESDGLIDDPQVRRLVEFLRAQRDRSVHGRTRETLRADRPADRGGYYSRSGENA